MAKKKVFVSFDYENDKHYKFLLEAWDANPKFDLTCPPQSVPAQRNRIRATERKRDAQEQVHGRADHRVHQAG